MAINLFTMIKIRKNLKQVRITESQTDSYLNIINTFLEDNNSDSDSKKSFLNELLKKYSMGYKEYIFFYGISKDMMPDDERRLFEKLSDVADKEGVLLRDSLKMEIKDFLNEYHLDLLIKDIKVSLDENENYVCSIIFMDLKPEILNELVNVDLSTLI